MANVLTMGSSVTCPHTPGKVGVSSSAKLTVQGKAVLLKAGINGKDISGCTIVTDTSKGIKKCEKVASVTAGEASKLTIANQPVMLDSLVGMTDGQPTPANSTLSASANQSKLSAV